MKKTILSFFIISSLILLSACTNVNEDSNEIIVEKSKGNSDVRTQVLPDGTTIKEKKMYDSEGRHFKSEIIEIHPNGTTEKSIETFKDIDEFTMQITREHDDGSKEISTVKEISKNKEIVNTERISPKGEKTTITQEVTNNPDGTKTIKTTTEDGKTTTKIISKN